MTADITKVTAAAQIYGDERASDQAASMQPTIDTLKSQLAVADSTINNLNSNLAAAQKMINDDQTEIADLEAQIAVLQGGGNPPPSSLLVGVRSDVSPMSSAVSTFGKQSTSITRLFQQALPASWSVDSQHWVAGQIPIVSYKSGGGNQASYAKSLEAVNGQLAYHHEPEADYAKGADFVKEFVAEYAAAKKGSTKVPFGMIAGAFQYRANGGTGFDGSYLPPASSVDFYALDTYQVGGSAPNAVQPLETDPRFLKWYSLVKDRGKPLYITEYGRGLVSDKTQDSLRAQVIAKDLAYLKKIGVKAWIYWWTADGSSGTSGKDWQFKDTASINAWTAAGK